MKFFDCDWTRIFELLPAWDKLAPAARRHFLQADSHVQTVDEKGFSEDLPALLAAGLVERVRPGRVRPAPDCVELRRVFRQLQRHPIFDAADIDQAVGAYQRGGFYPEECGGRKISDEWVYADDEEWLELFLAAADVPKWEAPLRPYERAQPAQRPPGEPRLDVRKLNTYFGPESGEVAQSLVRHARESATPLLLSKAASILPEELLPFLPDGFRGAVRYRLLFPALRQNTLDAVFWIHPKVGFYRHRPAPVRPPVVDVDGRQSPAFLMEDMTQVLMAATAGACPIKQNSSECELHAWAQAALVADLVPVSPWLEQRFPAQKRLQHAIDVAEILKLVSQEFEANTRMLRPTNLGSTWIRRSPADRLQAILSHLRNRRKARPFGPRFDFVPQDRFFDSKYYPLDLNERLESVWRSTLQDKFVPLTEFVEFHARSSHPLTDPILRGRCHTVGEGYSRSRVTDAESETAWRKILEDFFWDRLVPLGAVETGLRPQEGLCFRVNAIGRSLLGLAESVAYGPPQGEAPIVVQPTFEIVFLHPNAAAEADCTRFAERTGKGVGALFRITRSSVIRAASQGLTLQGVLAALTTHSGKSLPQNVVEELRGWFGRCHHLPLRRAFLLTAPDRETAERVKNLLGERAVLVTPTIVEYCSPELPHKFRKQLAEEGLFVNDPEPGDDEEDDTSFELSADDEQDCD